MVRCRKKGRKHLSSLTHEARRRRGLFRYHPDSTWVYWRCECGLIVGAIIPRARLAEYLRRPEAAEVYEDE